MSRNTPRKFEDLSEGFEAAYQTLDDIYTEGGDILYASYISLKSLPFGLRSTIDLIFNTVDLAYIRRETESLSGYPEDIEPTPCSIDTWARNAIPTQRKFKMMNPEINLMPTAMDARSMKSHISGRSTRSAMGRRSKPQGNIRNQKETQDSIGEAPQPFPIIMQKTHITEDEEKLRLKKEQESKKKGEENERMKKLKEELDEKEKKMKKESGELKNKLFTYDGHGNVMFINQLKYDQIPKIFTEVESKALDNPKELTSIVEAVRPKRRIEEANRIKTAPARDQEWVKNITSIQPPTFDVIKLNSGVTLVDGARVKYPPMTSSTSLRTFTRKDYYSQLVVPKHQTISLAYDKKLPQVSSHESFKLTSGAGSRLGVLEEMPDYEDVGEDAQIDQGIVAPAAKTKNQGKITLYGPGYQFNEDTPLSKFNNEISKNKTWGANPGIANPVIPSKLPKKPSSRGMLEIYGNIMRKPKDQPFITSKELWEAQGTKIKKPRDRPYLEKIEKKTKLPPPPYGFTMINAIPDYEDLIKSNQTRPLR